jgi:hypothetical protein
MNNLLEQKLVLDTQIQKTTEAHAIANARIATSNATIEDLRAIAENNGRVCGEILSELEARITKIVENLPFPDRRNAQTQLHPIGTFADGIHTYVATDEQSPTLTSSYPPFPAGSPLPATSPAAIATSSQAALRDLTNYPNYRPAKRRRRSLSIPETVDGEYNHRNYERSELVPEDNDSMGDIDLRENEYEDDSIRQDGAEVVVGLRDNEYEKRERKNIREDSIIGDELLFEDLDGSGYQNGDDEFNANDDDEFDNDFNDNDASQKTRTVRLRYNKSSKKSWVWRKIILDNNYSSQYVPWEPPKNAQTFTLVTNAATANITALYKQGEIIPETSLKYVLGDVADLVLAAPVLWGEGSRGARSPVDGVRVVTHVFWMTKCVYFRF